MMLSAKEVLCKYANQGSISWGLQGCPWNKIVHSSCRQLTPGWQVEGYGGPYQNLRKPSGPPMKYGSDANACGEFKCVFCYSAYVNMNVSNSGSHNSNVQRRAAWGFQGGKRRPQAAHPLTPENAVSGMATCWA
jgi:hypothetical protein